MLRNIRDERKLTREKLAELAELDTTFIYFLETGRRQPSLKTVFLLARAFKIAPGKIIEQVAATNPIFSGRGETSVVQKYLKSNTAGKTIRRSVSKKR